MMVHRMHRKLYCVSLISALGAIAACSAGGGDGSVSSKPAAKGAPLRSAVAARPTWATSARFRGEVPDDVTIAIQVHLQLREPDAAAAELAAISDPDGPEYGHFLSDAEYNAKYGPTDADIQALRAHLESKGLQVTHVPQNRTFIAATGTAAQVGRAFSTRLGLYNVDNDMRRAPINPPVMPDALKPLVLGVLGLTTPLQMKPRNVVVGGIQRNSIGPPPGTPAASSPMPSAAEPKAIGGTGTCSEWFGATLDTVDPPYGPGYPPLTYAPCGYLPAQIREAYGFTESVRQGNDGTGVTVAVVDAYLSPTLLADVQTYAAQNDPDYPFATSQLTTYWAPGTPTEPIPGWYIEQTLDVEAAHAIAPGAPIVAVAAQSQSDQDLVAAVNLIVENRLATIVSNSYETQEEAQLTDALIWEALATQAGLKGVGLYFSSGDSGDDQTFGISGTPSPTVDFPGSLPTVTSVGGTSLALGSLGQRLWETGWETGLSYLLDIYVPPPPPEEDASTGSPDGGGKPIPGEDSGSSLNDGTRVSPLQRVSFSTSFGEESDASDDAGVTDAGTFDGGRGPEDAGSDGGVFDGGVFDGGVFDGGVFDAGSDGGFVFDSGQPTFEEEWCPSPPGEFTFGSGGGISILFPQPAYQEGIVPSVLANAPGVPARVVPDVSMVADPVTGFLIGTSQLFGTYDEVVIGGTSLSSPLFAGVIALAQQHAKRTFGFANPLLYKASRSGAFSDAVPLASPEAVTVSPGTVATFDFGSNPAVDAGGAADAGSPGAECEFFFFNEQITIHTTVGYDDVTGLGSPSGAAFLAHVK